jgi:hypothetical protein
MEAEMAAGYLPLPGTEFGPCIDNCEHIDCKQTRTMAETICHYCGKAIGYDRGFYILEEKIMIHSACHETAIEAENKRLSDVLNIGAEKGDSTNLGSDK